jgi:2-keto-4-pentenoate hydratase/2-oxohepta-3-ene-1,7-dioic acid hydratase in catechol pathway
MRLCTFTLAGEQPVMQRAGVIKDTRVFELARRSTVSAVIATGARLGGLEVAGPGYDIDRVVLKAPLPRPGKILATIVNTQAMLGGGDVLLDRPRLDMKAPSAVVGPGEEIRAPESGIRPEVELAAIIGRKLTRANEIEATSGIFGYTVLNDVTAPSHSREDAYEAYRRDKASGGIRKTTLRGPLFRSKNHDTFCPMGPWICTPDECDDWTRLRMSTKFEEELVQDGSTAEYLFSPAKIAAYVSEFLTLEPGDVVSCGSIGWTPSALGALDPTEFVLPARGGKLELEIEGIGKLSNPVAYTA